MLNSNTNSFTKAQESAISHFQGPCLVLAGPGSGKTKVITHRVAHLIQEQKISPEHILTITFTKAAALEMKERFLLMHPNVNTTFATFHSCFYHILRNSHISYPQKFVSREEKQHILHRILKKLFPTYDEQFFAEMERLICVYINQLFAIEKLPPASEITMTQLDYIYKDYKIALQRQCVTDYDMLLADTYHLLKTNSEIREFWQKQFRYIQIDECQDMNAIQYEIVKFLAGKEQNVFMVGDDDQSIYRFRGSDVSLLKRFMEEYCPVKQILLETNFRSTSKIVTQSQQIIRENTNRFTKNIIAFQPEETGVSVKNFSLRDDMRRYVVECLQNAPESSLDDVAIICRTNAEVCSWSHILRQNQIPYQAKEEQNSVFHSALFLDLEAYMKICVGNYETNDILRIMNKPNRNLYREDVTGTHQIPEKLLEELVRIKGMRPFLAMKYIWNVIGYGKWLKKHLKDDVIALREAEELFQDFVSLSKNYSNLSEWLEYAAEDRQSVEVSSCKKMDIRKGVHILTMHSAKGLEFDTVYIPDVNKGKMPRGFLLDNETIEEERRLLYVAMTRAKRNLEIFYLKGTEGHKLEPSVFIQPLLN